MCVSLCVCVCVCVHVCVCVCVSLTDVHAWLALEFVWTMFAA